MVILAYLIFSTSFTANTVVRLYPAEIIPLYIRSKAVSLATAFNWAGNFSLTFFTPPGFENIQWKVCK